MEIIEQFSEEISFLRKYAYEYSQALDSDTFDLMIKSQVDLHIMFESQQAEITRLKEQNDKFRSALVEVISPDIHYDVMLAIALKALSEDK